MGWRFREVLVFDCIETIGVSLVDLFLLNYRYLHNSLSFNFLKSLPSQVGRRGKKDQGHTITTQYLHGYSWRTPVLDAALVTINDGNTRTSKSQRASAESMLLN